MNVDWVREYCLSLPHATEQIQWENDLVFKVGGKMFAVVPLEPARVWMSLKCEDEAFHEITERTGVIPAPYLARAKWIAIESEDALPREEVQRLLRRSYELVFAKLPKSVQKRLQEQASKEGRRRREKGRKSRARKA